ncbi:MAG: helix-turn-helix transcriptional regulator, partial [Microbacteriaceae bacterium]|nr:helix-turn-helix transcriptional regulator [Burkholderiaceae bacterium]
DNFELAERLLTVYLPLARNVGLPDHMIASHVMSARIASSRGYIDTSSRVLTELEYLGHHRQVPRVVASARLEAARMLLMQGNADASRDELSRAGDDALWQRVSSQHLPAHDVDTRAIGLVRWELHFGDPAAAAARLGQAVNEAMASARLHRALKLNALRAVALWRCERTGESVALFTQVLAQASREGFVRLILDEGVIIGDPLRGVNEAVQESGGDDPIFVDYLQRLLRKVGPAATAAASVPLPAGGPVDPLTQKELRVLQLLAEGYSNAAMAEKLFVSDSTVRTHLRNINTKLGASNRTQAVALARRGRLIR